MGQVSRSQEEAEMWDRYYWETIFHRSLVFIYILQAEALPAFVLDCLFKDACVENSLRRQTLYLSLSLSHSLSLEQNAGLVSSIIKIMTLSKAKVRQICLEDIIKDSVSLILVGCSFYIMQPTAWADLIWPSLHCPVGTGAEKTSTSVKTRLLWL